MDDPKPTAFKPRPRASRAVMYDEDHEWFRQRVNRRYRWSISVFAPTCLVALIYLLVHMFMVASDQTLEPWQDALLSSIPVLVMITSLGTIGVIMASGSTLKRRVIRSRCRLCPDCEYDLRGDAQPSYCPECGAAIDMDQLRRFWAAYIAEQKQFNRTMREIRRREFWIELATNLSRDIRHAASMRMSHSARRRWVRQRTAGARRFLWSRAVPIIGVPALVLGTAVTLAYLFFLDSRPFRNAILHEPRLWLLAIVFGAGAGVALGLLLGRACWMIMQIRYRRGIRLDRRDRAARELK